MNRKRLVDSLVLHEGVRNLPYEDSVGKLTIGIGHNLDDVPLSSRAIHQILDDDINTAVSELDRAFRGWRRNLSEPRQNVLIEMMFNMGAPTLRTFTNFWDAVDNQDYKKASQEMLDSKWARQVGQRARRLAEQMFTGKFYD